MRLALGAVERLDLALLVNRQHQGMGRRVEVEPDDVGQLGGKAGIARALEGAHPVRLELVLAPDARTEPSEMPTALAIARPVQWIAWCGGSVQVNSTTRAVFSAASARSKCSKTNSTVCVRQG